MDGELITINGVTAFVYYDDDTDRIEVVNLDRLSHDLQTAMNRLEMLERDNKTVSTIGENNVKSIRVAISLVDHMLGKKAHM